MKRLIMKIRSLFRKRGNDTTVEYNACIPISAMEKAAYGINDKKAD